MCYSAHKYDCGHLGRKNKIQCQRMSKFRAFIGRVLYDEHCKHVLPKPRHKLCRACESNSEPSTSSEKDSTDSERGHGRRTHRSREASGSSSKKDRHHHRGGESKNSSRPGSERSSSSRETKRSHQSSNNSGSSGKSRKDGSKAKKETQKPLPPVPTQQAPIPQPGNRNRMTMDTNLTLWPGPNSQHEQTHNATNAWLQSVENMSAVPEPLAPQTARPVPAAARYPAVPPAMASFQLPVMPMPAAPAYDPAADPTYAPRPVSSFYGSDGGPPGSTLPGETSAKPRPEFFTVYVDTEIGEHTVSDSPPPIPPKSQWRNLTPRASGSQQLRQSHAPGTTGNDTNEYVPARSQWRQPAAPGQSRYAGLPGTTSEYMAQSKRPEKKTEPMKETIPSMYAEYYATVNNPHMSFSARKAEKLPEVRRPSNITFQPPLNRASVNPSSSRKPDPSRAQPNFNRTQSAPEQQRLQWSNVMAPHGNGIKPTPSTSGSQVFMHPRAAPMPPQRQVSAPENPYANPSQVRTVDPRIVKESWGSASGPSSGRKSQRSPAKTPIGFTQFGKDLRDRIQTLRKEPSEASFACQDAKKHDAQFAPPTPAKRGFFGKLSGSK